MKIYLYILVFGITWAICLIVVPRVIDGVFDKLMTVTAMLIFLLIGAICYLLALN